MHWAAQAALAGLVSAGLTIEASSAAPQDNAPAKERTPARVPWIDGIVDRNLISIDGSQIALNASDGGLTREIVAPNGAVQKTLFRFINERLGTVTDSRDTGKVNGVFRVSDSDVSVQYADGSSESLLANSAGGISIETKSPKSAAYCSAWYPEGHVFSVDERKAALAQYASRLGLPDGDKKIAAAAHTACSADALPQTATAAKSDGAKGEVADSKAVQADASAIAVVPAAAAAIAATAAGKSVASKRPQIKSVKDALKITTDLAGDGHAIEVRPSEVHRIDNDPVAQPVTDKVEAAASQKVASLAPSQAPTAPSQAPTPPNEKGASSCLSVESDGNHWGFRNRCDYSIQFAYCVMNGTQTASCLNGAVAGSVAAKGFGALLSDESLKETNVTHDFRWVACQGGAGEVIPRLEQINPPSGRCVH